jgi:hypothetical protein
MAEALTGGALGLGAKSAVVGGDGAKRDRRRDNSPMSVFKRKPAPDSIRVGDRFASRKRVKTRNPEPFPFRFY